MLRALVAVWGPRGSVAAPLSFATNWGSSAGPPTINAEARSIAATARFLKPATAVPANASRGHARNRDSNAGARTTLVATRSVAACVTKMAKSAAEAVRTSVESSLAFPRRVKVSGQSVATFLTAAETSSFVQDVLNPKRVGAPGPHTSAAVPRRPVRHKARTAEAFPMVVGGRFRVASVAINRLVEEVARTTCAGALPRPASSSGSNVAWSPAAAVEISIAAAAPAQKPAEAGVKSTPVDAPRRPVKSSGPNVEPPRTLAVGR